MTQIAYVYCIIQESVTDNCDSFLEFSRKGQFIIRSFYLGFN